MISLIVILCLLLLLIPSFFDINRISPIKVNILKTLLKDYHNRDYIIEGFTNGFSLGYLGDKCPTMGTNKSSVKDNMQIVQSKIEKEIILNRISGPYLSVPYENFKVSPLALRPKKGSNNYRLLHNLSYPYDSTSVNLNIPREHSAVKYESLSSAINLIQKHKTCYLAKSDIADAFRLIPLHYSQNHLTGFKFDDKYYFDKCLPQGCSSSCFIFEKFSDSIKWALNTHYTVGNIVKVLDDFLFINNSYEGSLNDLDNFYDFCEKVGIPIAEHKTEGPSRCLTFLGIEINTVTMTASLPKDKLVTYEASVIDLMSRNKCTLRELKSVIGKLQFSTSVIPVGKCFLRRLYNATIGIKKPNHYINVSSEMKEDLSLWYTFLRNYNGITIITPRNVINSCDIHLYSDSCKYGYGGTFEDEFICGSFPIVWHKFSIEVLELYPIFLLLHVFIQKLSNTKVIFHCDNISIVHIINKQSSRCKIIMKLLRPMILTMLNNNISFSAIHIPGHKNKLCDVLSRSQITPETLARYGMKRSPTDIPFHLLPQNLMMT